MQTYTVNKVGSINSWQIKSRIGMKYPFQRVKFDQVLNQQHGIFLEGNPMIPLHKAT